MNVEKLKKALENIKMLQAALRDKRQLLDKEIELVATAKKSLCEILYDMTGGEFYKELAEEKCK